MMCKRGRYLNYLQNNSNEPIAKIPRQTTHNRRNHENKKVLRPHFARRTSRTFDALRPDTIDLMDISIVSNNLKKHIRPVNPRLKQIYRS